jgi:DNA polymerase III subunit gamma/tau
VSLDTKYRPRAYADVLGQEGTVQILRQYVRSGAGFHQSYLFAGPWGSGKTTLGRILARSLLCFAPVDGGPCDACPSCRSILEGGSSENFFEIDAATNSGKDSVRKIVEEIQYSTFSGKRRLYLFDESHRLTLDALDALLKPMEDTVPGGEDKSLVCIFCTTEPEKMRATILSRCAPAFVIKPVVPEQIGSRLAQICDAEGITYERDALTLIGELTECHIRDALKAVEGVSMLGPVSRENVAKYLHLDLSRDLLDLVLSIRSDLPGALSRVDTLTKRSSPSVLYEKLAELCLLSYKVSLGIGSFPAYMNSVSIQRDNADDLLVYADRFSSRPGRPTASMLLCDVAQLHRELTRPTVSIVQAPPSSPKAVTGKVSTPDDKPKMVDDVYVHPRAVKKDDASSPPPTAQSPSPLELRPLEFSKLVKMRAMELAGLPSEPSGRQGRDDMGDAGTHQSG